MSTTVHESIFVTEQEALLLGTIDERIEFNPKPNEFSLDAFSTHSNEVNV